MHPNIIIVFLTYLMHKFCILIYLLHSSTCFEHYYARPQEVKLCLLVQPLVSSLSLGDFNTQVKKVLVQYTG